MNVSLPRTLTLVFLAAFAFVSVSCSRDPEPSKKLIAIIVPSQDNPFFKAEADAAAARARELGYRVRIDSHDDDAFKQDNLIDVAIASNASVVILDNAGADASISAVRRATQAGIACFLIDREISVRGIAKAQIIADNAQGARLAGTAFARDMGGKGAYAELVGRESDSNAQIRTAGFHAELDGIPTLVMVARQSANWSQSEGFQKTETVLQAHSNIRGIIAGNDTMALGAAAAIKSSGLRDVVVVGFDGSPDALQAIRQGSMAATVLQPAVKIARMAVEQADHYLRTGSTGQPEHQLIPCELVTKQNADQFGVFEKRIPE
jgi:erythritol transport system substrate-binding protein